MELADGKHSKSESQVLEAPILNAIQWIPGETAPEKHRDLSKITNRLAENVGAAGDFADIPEALLPLVRAKVACITRNHEAIVTALRSDDAIVRNSAFSAKWFFDGSNENVASYDFFSRNLFQEVSFSTRMKIKKHLAKQLMRKRNTKLAEEFFDGICRDFGRSEALCLLVSCGRDFINQLLEDVTICPRTLARLYRKYPDLAIRYLRSMKTADTEDMFHRTTRKAAIEQYARFLPDLIRNHLEAFLELQEYGKCCTQLSNKRSVLFLKYASKALVEKPLVYLKLLPLKLVTQRLSREDFEAIFAQYFPKSRDSFDFDQIKWCLEHQPREVQQELVLKTFEKVYRQKLFDFPKLIDGPLLALLPDEDRIRIAKIKVEIQSYDPEDKYYDLESSWKCYLALDDAVKFFKDLAQKRSNEYSRRTMLCQMLYAYKVNAPEQLHEALRYYLKRHRNEKWPVLESIVDCVDSKFDLVNLSHENWEVLHELLQFALAKYSESTENYSIMKILTAGIHHQLMHDLPCDRFVKLLFDLANCHSWNVLEEFPEYERVVLNTIARMLASKEKSKHEGSRLSFIERMVKAMYDFNRRHKNDSASCHHFSVKDYPWLYEELREVYGEMFEHMNHGCFYDLFASIKNNEWEIYESLTGKPVPLENKIEFRDLAKDAKEVSRNWESYYKKCRNELSLPETVAFLKTIRWYQEIPIKFAKKAIADVFAEDDPSMDGLRILALLLDGPSFARLAEPFEPKELTIKNDKDIHATIRNLMSDVAYVNPPVPLDFMGKFCDGDWMQVLLRALYSTCQRTSLSKVIPFAQNLAKQRVSVKKHGIRVICKVAPLDQVAKDLGELWKTETHHSIRAVLLTQIQSYFREAPTESSFSLVKMAMETLTEDDLDQEPVQVLTSLSSIPNEFISEYLTLFFERIQQLDIQRHAEKVFKYAMGMLFNNITPAIAALLPEKLLEKIVTEYVLKRYVHDNATNFLSIYLQPPAALKQKHVEFARRKIMEIIKKDWNVTDINQPYIYPYRVTFRNMVKSLKTIEVVDLFLELFDSTLKPQQEPYSYLYLTCMRPFLIHQNAVDALARDFVQILPRLVATFPAELFVLIPECLKDFIQYRPFYDDASGRNSFAIFVDELLRLKSSMDVYLLSAYLLRHNIDQGTGLSRDLALKLRNSEYACVSTLMNYYETELG